MKSSKRIGLRVLFFLAPYEQYFKHDFDKDLKLLAKDFEIYVFDDKPFISHMYSSGVYHWRTKHSSDLSHWQSLNKKVENNTGRIFIMSFMVLNTGRVASQYFYINLNLQPNVIIPSRYQFDYVAKSFIKKIL